MRQTLILIFAYAILGLVGCDAKRPGSQQASVVESVQRAAAEQASAVEQSIKALSDSQWGTDKSVDKMTNIPKNKLINHVSTGNHFYEVIFDCDSDGLGVRLRTFSENKEGARIPWDIGNGSKGTRNIRLRYGDKLAQLNMEEGDYGNSGNIVLNGGASLLLLSASLTNDIALRTTTIRDLYRDTKTILSDDVLNLADIFPGEVVELNPATGRVLINEFLGRCDKVLPGEPSSTPDVAPQKGPSSFSVETNIHNGWWWSGPVGMWASRASGLSTCPWGGIELMRLRVA